VALSDVGRGGGGLAGAVARDRPGHRAVAVQPRELRDAAAAKRSCILHSKIYTIDGDAPANGRRDCAAEARDRRAREDPGLRRLLRDGPRRWWCLEDRDRAGRRRGDLPCPGPLQKRATECARRWSSARAAKALPIVSVDNGIRAGEVVRRRRSWHSTCHHGPSPCRAELPRRWPCSTRIKRGCAYPEKNLCGVGWFKLAQGLLGTLDWPAEKLRRVLASFLKMWRSGRGDVVPLTGENRIIVKHGLDGLRVVKNKGLRALLKVAGLGEGAHDSGPGRLPDRSSNQCGRQNGDGDRGDRAAAHRDDDRAGVLAQELDALNTDRQAAEARIVATILEECARVPVTASDAALVFAARAGIAACWESWRRGWWSDSTGRLSCWGARRKMDWRRLGPQHPDVSSARGAGVHAGAVWEVRRPFSRGGIDDASDRVEEFRNRLNAYAAARLTADDFIPALQLDSAVELHELTNQAAMEALSLEPFAWQSAAAVFGARRRDRGRAGVDEGEACAFSVRRAGGACD